MKYSEEQLIQFIIHYYSKYNTVPVCNTFHRFGYPPKSTYRKRFGSWRVAIERAGLRCLWTDAIEMACSQCQKSFKRRVSAKKSKSGFYFCSSICAATYNNKNRKRKEKSACIQCGKETKLKFCSNGCQGKYKWESITKPAIERGDRNSKNTLRKYLIERDGYKCSYCQLSIWFDKLIPLCIDHIDGNPANDLPNNIRLLCQNCHGQTSTFAGRNKGNGRKSRGIKRD